MIDEKSKRDVFLIAPNGGQYRQYVATSAEAVLIYLGYSVARIFTTTPPDSVVVEVIQRISEARFVVAIAVAGNENIFLEIGVALALKKKLYLIGRTKRSFNRCSFVEQIEDAALQKPHECGEMLLSLLERDFPR